MKVYISAPMSGVTDNNKGLFFEIEKVLRQFGFDVFNPARNTGAGWLDLMLYDLKQMERCQVVMFTKGWEKSPGCTIEHIVAKRLNIPIVYAENLIPL